MDQTKAYLAMCKASEEIQEYFNNRNNRIGKTIYSYPEKGEIPIGKININENKFYCEEYPKDIKVTWLPTQDQLQDLSSAFGISGMLYEFNDFVFGNQENKDNALRYSERFKTVEQLWLGFIMEQNYEKHWNGSTWK